MTFEYTPTDDGFRIRDTIENAWADVDSGGRRTPAPASVDRFRVPLDDAIRVDAAHLQFDGNFALYARDPISGEITDSFTIGSELELPAGTYELETTLTLFKLYLYVEDSPVTITDNPGRTTLNFDGTTPVVIGVRSHHQQPAGVVTAAQDPRELMRAISTFGSAMKTFSPERSFPSLRGHPPELAVRGQTSIPDAFTPPETGITVELPPEYAAIFTATPLAYYLGATLEPGLDPRLVASDAVHEFDLDDLSVSIYDLLRHCFLLDCIVRGEGLYPTNLVEKDRLEDRISLDYRTLYELPVAERTARYLDVPLDITRDLLTWHAVADVDPVPLNAEALPYLAHRMAVIRSPPTGRVDHSSCCEPDPTSEPDPTREPIHSDEPDEVDASSPLRSFTPGEPDTGNSVAFVDPAAFDARHNIWVGDGLPIRGSKPTLGSYLRSIEATPLEDRIETHVVVTDPSPRTDAAAIAKQYSNEGFEITMHDDPTTSELQSILLEDHDFLHYCGPVTDEGLECLDGPLDVRTLPRTGVSAFFLDGECSYRQGLSLIRVGAIGGVVTTTEQQRVDKNLGLTLASLLDHGFPLHGAVDILTRLEDAARYTIVGDSFHQVCKTPILPLLSQPTPDRATPDTIALTERFYTSKGYGIGSQVGYSGDEHPKYIDGEHEVTLTRDQFAVHADHIEAPIIVDGELHWPQDYSADELWALLR